MNPNRIIRSTAKGLTVMAVVTVGASCATRPREESPADRAEACAALKSIIAAAPNGFDAVKRSGESQHRLGVRWAAQGILPRTDCEVWKWGGGRNNYLCMWQKADAAVAERDFEQGKRVMGQCLGNQWSMVEKPAKAGRVAVYANPNTETRVSLRVFSDPRGYRTSWQTSLVVGNELKDLELPYPPAP